MKIESVFKNVLARWMLKFSKKWGMQITEMIFDTCARLLLQVTCE